MGRKKAAQNCEIKPWLSANPDCREKLYIQVGLSLPQSKQFQSLNYGTQVLYYCMALEACGRIEFALSHGNAKRKYGIPHSTFDRGVKELIEAGFIEWIADDDYSQYRANSFRFSFQWKNGEKG